MRTDLFDFELPPESIALRPAHPRDAARLLVVQPGAALQDRRVSDLAQVLRPGDQLVVNDTKVIPAQLAGRRVGRDAEPRIEATLIKRLDGSRWQALVKPAKKLIEGDTIRFGRIELRATHLVGHTPGSIALLYDDPKGHPHLFTGDCLFPGGVGNTDKDPKRFASLYGDVVGKVFDRLPDETWIYPGHGKDTTLGDERPHLAEWKSRGW